MGARSYAKLTIEEFGLYLIQSRDLDPVYLALHELHEGKIWDTAFRKRWLVAYWCLYHCASACSIAQYEEDEFWYHLFLAAENTLPAPNGKRWQRGHERRHFRGIAATTAVTAYKDRFGQPEGLVDYVTSEGGAYTTVANRACELPLFGPWMSFKICDMTDRVLGIPVDFSQANVFMFKDPVKAALATYKLKSGFSLEDAFSDKVKVKNESQAIDEVVGYLTKHFADQLAPPLFDRPVGLQEVETILCKWKSHMNGHYPLNNDIDEINDGLQEWLFTSAHDRVAEFMKYVPRKPQL